MSLFLFDFFNKGVIQKISPLWRDGGSGSLKSERKRTEGVGQVYLYVHSVKKLPHFFQIANRYLSDKLLGSW